MMMTVGPAWPVLTTSARTLARPPDLATTLRHVGWRTAHPSELSSAPVLKTLSLVLMVNVKPKVELITSQYAQFDNKPNFSDTNPILHH